MANQISQITFGEVELIAVDADPSTGGGLSSDDIGSISVLGTHTDAQMWMYYGGSATSWRRVMAMTDSSALTLGVVPYINSSGNLAQDTNHFWDSTNHRLGIGVTTPLGSLHVASTADAPLILERATAGGILSSAISLRSERGSIGSPTTLVNGDWVGKIDFNGYDGTGYQVGARIIGITNGTIATSSVPTDLALYTGPGGASTVERFRVNNAGHIITNATASEVYRTTNAGADQLAHILIDPSNSLTSGNSFAFDTSDNLLFLRSNGTRRIARAAFELVNTTDTAASEAGGIGFFTQSGGTAISEKMRIQPAGNVGINTTGPGTTLDVNGVASMQGFAPYLTSTATANTTTTLTTSSNRTLVYTGSTTGQIVKLPDATTLTVGREFKIWNTSTVSMVIQDNSGTVLTRLSAAEKVELECTGIGTAAGTWAVDSTSFGRNFFSSSTITTSTNSSTTTYQTACTITTDDLPSGNYRISTSVLSSASNPNRNIEVIITDGTTTYYDQIFNISIGANENSPAVASVILSGISGVKTLNVQYRVSGGGTTITVADARVDFWRVS